MRSSRPLSTSHTLSVLSPEAEIASRPPATDNHALTGQSDLQGAQFAPPVQVPHFRIIGLRGGDRLADRPHKPPHP